MDINVLRERIRANDSRAFLDLSEEYGWILYSFLSKRIHEPDMLQRAYEQVLTDFYRNIRHSKEQGSVEPALMAVAEAYCGKLPAERQTAHSFPGCGFWVALVLLILLNIICLWFIGGILMEIGIIPYFDLGYSWIRTVLSV